MKKGIYITILLLVFGVGLFLPTPERFLSKREKKSPQADIELPFTLILTTYNRVAPLEQTLRSVFAQKYKNYRLIVTLDGSTRELFNSVATLIDQMGGAERTNLIHYPDHRGNLSSIYSALQECGEEEIALILSEGESLASDRSLELLNSAHQEGDFWVVSGKALDLPEFRESVVTAPTSFVASLSSYLTLSDLFFEGTLFRSAEKEAILKPIQELSGKRRKEIDQIVTLRNGAPLLDELNPDLYTKCVKALQEHPKKKILSSLKSRVLPQTSPDLVIFSEDHPLELLSLLESVQKNLTGVGKVTILYTASSGESASSYAELKGHFETLSFERLSKEGDHKKKILSTLFGSIAKEEGYIAFATDSTLIVEPVDLRKGMLDLSEAGGYGLYYSLDPDLTYSKRFGRSSAPPLLSSLGTAQSPLFAWEFASEADDWSCHNSPHLALYRKKELEPLLASLPFTSVKTLFLEWGKATPEKGIGLCYPKALAITLEDKGQIR